MIRAIVTYRHPFFSRNIMDSINGRLSSLFARARNTDQGTDQRDGSPSSDAGSRLPPPRDPSEPPPIHQTGRRRPAALAQPSSESPFPFTRLPLEMQQAVLHHLDTQSMAKVVQTSKQMKEMVDGHPYAPRRLRLMSAPPPAHPDPAYLEELRTLSEHLSAEDAHTLAQRALSPKDGIVRPWLLGPLLSSRTRDDAERVAQAMDPAPRTSRTSPARPHDPFHEMIRLSRMNTMVIAGVEDPFLLDHATEQRDRERRGNTLVTILGDIGNPKNPDVYEPFLERCARPSPYEIDHAGLTPLFRRVPSFASDRICATLLHETGNAGFFGIDTRRLNVALLFLASGPLSPARQDAIHDRARELFVFSEHPIDPRQQAAYRRIFSAGNIAERFPDSPEQRDKWNAFREAVLPA
ncbi:MAG: hypothetical protein ABS43_00750 [Bordetella sp. SCN 67-23]|nr:F-box protein [Burkholderiales bacterium]ODS76714.1 MAG: hypothetical protein ABS43_00750 [Bordetella sp. SCN 67-23]OJW93836.1 MAG: hypothetical protein BGO71_18260 [Burkholderiales bacterium 67-32]